MLNRRAQKRRRAKTRTSAQLRRELEADMAPELEQRNAPRRRRLARNILALAAGFAVATGAVTFALCRSEGGH